MHVHETGSPSTLRLKPHVPVTTVIGVSDVDQKVLDLFRAVYGEEPVCEKWPVEAVRDRLTYANDAQLHPVRLAAWGDGRIGEAGKLIGLLIGFELVLSDHKRAFGARDRSGDIVVGFGGLPHRIGYVQDLLVPQSCRKRGVGYTLLKEAARAFKEKRMNSVFCRVRSSSSDPFRNAMLDGGWRSIMTIDDHYALVGRSLF